MDLRISTGKKAATAYAPSFGMNKELKESFDSSAGTKGTISQAQVLQVNKDIGEPHPYDYKLVTDLCKKHAFTSGIVEKILNGVWGAGFSTKCADERAKGIIDTWLHDSRFKLVGREWLKQAVRKGFSPLELGGDGKGVPKGIKVLTADRVYIKRDDKGMILQYNQVRQNAAGMVSAKDAIAFKPDNICPLHLNRFDDEAYGYGLIYPLLHTVDNLVKAEKDMHKLLTRKANSPIWAKLGTETEMPTPEGVDDFASKMTFMNNQTEWATDASVDLKVLDFGNIGQKFETIINHDSDMMFFGSQVPEVIMGRGNVPEGLAVQQGEEWQRFLAAVQMEAEPAIDDLFDRILMGNGISGVKVEIVWGSPTETQTNTMVTQLSTLVSNPMVSPNLRTEFEKKLAGCFDIDPSTIDTPEQAIKRETERNKQPPVPGKPQNEFYEGELHRD